MRKLGGEEKAKKKNQINDRKVEVEVALWHLVLSLTLHVFKCKASRNIIWRGTKWIMIHDLSWVEARYWTWWLRPRELVDPILLTQSYIVNLANFAVMAIWQWFNKQLQSLNCLLQSSFHSMSYLSQNYILLIKPSLLMNDETNCQILTSTISRILFLLKN